jgi:hypothetical protein
MSVKEPLEQMSILAILGLVVVALLYGFLFLMVFVTPSSLPPAYPAIGQSNGLYSLYGLLGHLFAILK